MIAHHTYPNLFSDYNNPKRYIFLLSSPISFSHFLRRVRIYKKIKNSQIQIYIQIFASVQTQVSFQNQTSKGVLLFMTLIRLRFLRYAAVEKASAQKSKGNLDSASIDRRRYIKVRFILLDIATSLLWSLGNTIFMFDPILSRVHFKLI